MKDIKKPEFMLEAMRGRRGFIAVLEMLIAIVVFVVSSIAMSIGTIPLMIGYFVSDPEFMKTAQAVADGSAAIYAENAGLCTPFAGLDDHCNTFIRNPDDCGCFYLLPFFGEEKDPYIRIS